MANDKTAGIDELQLNKASKAMKDYLKQLEKAGVSQKQINSLTKELNKAHKELNLVKRTDDYTKAQQRLNKEYRDWGRSLEMIKNIGAGVLTVHHIRDVEGMAINMINLNKEMHRNLVLAGKNGEAMKNYQNTLNNLSIQLGATQKDGNEIIKVLATKQYAGTAKDIDTAAAATYKLAEATKLSKEEIAEITVELQKWGQISAKTTEAMYADVMKVAKANGITQNGIKTILKQTQEWSGIMKAFGKSPQDVQRYNLSLSKTVSALEKVGISAQDTTKMLDELTDPTRIEENIAKYAALGISIEDALSGNITGEDMAAGLKDFGEKLKTMGPIAGAQYAKAFGVSYKNAIKATTAELGEMNEIDMTPEEKASKELAAAMESTRNSVEKINSVFEKIGGYMRKWGPAALIFIGTLGSFIFAKIGGTIEKIAVKFVNSFRKGSKEMSEDLASSMRDAASKSGDALGTGMFGAASAAISDISKLKEESDADERKRRTAMEKQNAKEYGEFLKQAIEAVAGQKVEIGEAADLVFKDKEIAAQEKLGEIQQAQYEKTKGYYERFVELTKVKEELQKLGDDAANEGAKEVLRLRQQQLEDMQKIDQKAIDGLKEAADEQQKVINNLEETKKALKPKIEDDISEALNSNMFKLGDTIGSAIKGVETIQENIADGFKQGIEGIKAKFSIDIGNGKEIASRLSESLSDVCVEFGDVLSDGTNNLNNTAEKVGNSFADGTNALVDSSNGIGEAMNGVINQTEGALTGVSESIIGATSGLSETLNQANMEITGGEELTSQIMDTLTGGSEVVGGAMNGAINKMEGVLAGAGGAIGEGVFGNIPEAGRSFGETAVGAMQDFKLDKIEVDSKEAAKDIVGSFGAGREIIDNSAKNISNAFGGAGKDLEKAARSLPNSIEVKGGAEEGKKLHASAFGGIGGLGKKIGEGLSSVARRIKLKVSGGKDVAKDINKGIKSDKIGKKAGEEFAKSAKKTKIKSKLKVDNKSTEGAGKSIAARIKEGLRNFKIGVKAAAGNSKILGAMMKLGGALGGVAKVAGKLGGAMGIVAIVMRIIGKALEKMEGPMDMINTIMDNLVGILTPILEAILKPLLPLIQVLIKALLPPLLKILSLLIKVLHYLMKPIVMLIKALGHIPGLGFLKDVAEGIDAATGPEVTKALDDAANKISDSNTDLSKKTEENTEAVEGKTKGESLSFNGGKVMVKSSTSSASSSDDSESSNTTSTASNSSSSEGASTKNNESQTLTIAALSKVKESIDSLNNKFTVFMNKMNDMFDKMTSADSTKMYQERAAIEQAFGLDERKIVNVNIADAAGIMSGARNVISNIFNGGGDHGAENHATPSTEVG